MIIEYRFYHKLKSTYLDGLLKSVSSDGKIHTVFRQTETRTGRLSSAEPNLQNIPIRNDFAKNIRKFFIAEDDHVLIDADYDQIELRITASLSQDKNMINNFLTGKDVHTTTAMKIFHRDTAEEITPQMRGVAKSINYGIIYGMGAKKFAQELGVPLKEAKQYIANYFEMYPNIKEYMETVIEGCKLTGYVKTVLNRIRYVPEITYVTRKLQANGERIAMNTPIQGSSADIIKLAMVNVYNRLKKENLDAKLILQVHDELLIESHKSCADRVAVIVKEEMENAFKLEVPLVVDVKIGGSWFDVH
jgi:DNA polymerase-1